MIHNRFAIRYTNEGGTVLMLNDTDITNAVLSAPITLTQVDPGGPFKVALELLVEELDVDLAETVVVAVAEPA